MRVKPFILGGLLLSALILLGTGSPANAESAERPTGFVDGRPVFHMREPIGGPVSAYGVEGRDDRHVLCGFVRSQLRDELPGNQGHRYAYQRIFLHHAGVQPSDTREEEARKVREVWHLFEGHSCQSAGFNVSNGSLLKYGIYHMNDSFVYDAARRWRVNLNRIDASDGRTALDYVVSELDRESRASSPLVGRLKNYFILLRDGGAKRRYEIDGVDCTFSNASPACKLPG